MPTATAGKHLLELELLERMAFTLFSRSSLWVQRVGNLPALLRPGPRRQGICLMTDSEARKWLYFFASFLMSFLFLLSFLSASTSM